MKTYVAQANQTLNPKGPWSAGGGTSPEDEMRKQRGQW